MKKVNHFFELKRALDQALGSGVVLGIVALILYLSRRLNFEGDSKMIFVGTQAFLECLKNGQVGSCSGVYYFAPLQYLLAFPWVSLGFQEGFVLTFFALVSLFSFLVLGFVGYRFLKPISEKLAFFWILILGTSPLLHYSRSTFSEMLSALLLTLFTVECIQGKKNVRLFIFTLLVCFTKEVVFPFLIFIAFCCWLPKFPREKIKALSLGIVTGFIFNGLWNEFRYGSFRNTYLLQSLFQTPTLSLKINFLFAQLFSPTGGLFFFWPLFLGVLLLVIIKTFYQKPFTPLKEPSQIRVLGILGIFFLLLVGFSNWFPPFGWRAWGHRLIFPWIPPILILILYFYSKIILEFFKNTPLKSLKGTLISLLILVPGFIQMRSLFANDVYGKIFAFTPSCPIQYYPDTQPQKYYECLHEMMWPQTFYLSSLFEVHTFIQLVHGIISIVLVGLLFMKFIQWKGDSDPKFG